MNLYRIEIHDDDVNYSIKAMEKIKNIDPVKEIIKIVNENL